MWKIKSAFSDDYRLSNKNFRNNQNYVVDRKIKDDFILDYLSRWKSNYLLKILIYFFWKKLDKDIRYRYLVIILINIFIILYFLLFWILAFNLFFKEMWVVFFFVWIITWSIISILKITSQIFVKYLSTYFFVLGFRYNLNYKSSLIYQIKTDNSIIRHKLLNFFLIASIVSTSLLFLILILVL